MIFIIVALFVLGFFFPPAWLALIGYVIYIFASRKSRRDEAVEGRIKAMVSSGKERATFNDLYFEGARSFAVARGAKASEHDAASTHVLINGQRYFVTFLRTNRGGTDISLDSPSSVEKMVTAHLPADTSQGELISRTTLNELRKSREDNSLFGSKKAELGSPIGVPSGTIHDLNQVTSVLQACGYRVEQLANKDMAGIPQERIAVFKDGIRFVITFDKSYITFLDAYRLNGTFNHKNMAKWNAVMQFASFTYSAGADIAIVKHHMACGLFGVSDNAIREFAKIWEQLMVAFRKQHGLSLSDQI